MFTPIRNALHRLPALVAASSLSLGLAGASYAQAPTKPLKPVAIGVGTQVIDVTYPWLSLPIALGYWRDEGYDVKLVPVGGSLQGLQQLVGGGVQFAQMNSTVIVQANAENNIAARAILGNGVLDWSLAVMQDGPIRSIADLKGKKIGISTPATGGMPLLKGYLRNNGINPDADVSIIATGFGAPVLEALKSDRVQAIMYWGTAMAGFENAGGKLRYLFDPTWRQLPDFTFGTLQKIIDSDPAMVEAMARGAAKASLFAITNPECAVKLHWKHFPGSKLTGADEPTLLRWGVRLMETQLDSMKNAYNMHGGGKSFGKVDVAAYGRMQDFMMKDGMIKRTVPAETFVINRPGFAESVDKFDRNAVIEAAKACKGI